MELELRRDGNSVPEALYLQSSSLTTSTGMVAKHSHAKCSSWVKLGLVQVRAGFVTYFPILNSQQLLVMVRILTSRQSLEFQGIRP